MNDLFRKIRIVSDGSPYGTRVEDIDTGQLLLCERVELVIDASTGRGRAIVTLLDPEVRLELGLDQVLVK